MDLKSNLDEYRLISEKVRHGIDLNRWLSVGWLEPTHLYSWGAIDRNWWKIDENRFHHEETYDNQLQWVGFQLIDY